jgi:hypothetical protein
VAYAILLVLVLVVAVVATMYVLRGQVRHRQHVDEVIDDERTPTLEYEVPTGQDPSVILAALTRDGYTATVDPSGAHQVVSIACPTGVDRERARVRSVIESANVTAPDDGAPVDVEVRFRDET